MSKYQDNAHLVTQTMLLKLQVVECLLCCDFVPKKPKLLRYQATQSCIAQD